MMHMSNLIIVFLNISMNFVNYVHVSLILSDGHGEFKTMIACGKQ
jgi:hypothetical protein